jgi:phage baseplate assembly protein gpV
MNSPAIGVIGIVTKLQPENCRAKVNIEVPNGQFESDWLSIVQRSAASPRDAEYWMPSVGDRVLCLLDDRREQGFVIGCFYTQEQPQPSGMTKDTIYAVRRDDSHIKHNVGNSEINAVGVGDCTATVGGDGEINVAGQIKVNGATVAKVGVNSVIEITANAMVKITSPTVIIEGGLAKVPWPGPTPISVEVPAPDR